MSATSPLLGRCKSCDYVLFSTRENVQVAESFKDVKKDQAYAIPNTGVFGRCGTFGHKAFKLKAVKGTYSKDHKCDARCLNAKGNDCTCSCGGANHGKGHAVEVIVAAVKIVREDEAASEAQEKFLRSLLNERVLPDRDAQTGEQRRHVAETKLDQGLFTKRQASKTIEWLLTLPKKEN